MTQRTILIVDDEEDIREILSLSLSDWGYHVQTAGSGVEALRQFEEIHPDIVLTDIRMPGINGIELLRRMKAIHPDTEVIMITGHGDMDLAIQSLKYEATDFITKPIHDEILEISLKRAQERISLRQGIREHTESLQKLVDEILGLSHSIKTIAAGLVGGAFVLEKGIELGHKDYLLQGWEMTKGSVERIKTLALDILHYARSGEVKLQLCDPNAPLAEVAEFKRVHASQGDIDLQVEVRTDLMPVYMDPGGIYRCLLDLLTNALEAFPGPTASGSERRVVRLRTSKIEGWGVEYEIADNGCGMDDETQRNVFKRFFTTKGTSGTGVGLMAARKIVDAHGGTIELKSEKGKGTTVRIRIPERTET